MRRALTTSDIRRINEQPVGPRGNVLGIRHVAGSERAMFEPEFHIPYDQFTLIDRQLATTDDTEAGELKVRARRTPSGGITIGGLGSVDEPKDAATEALGGITIMPITREGADRGLILADGSGRSVSVEQAVTRSDPAAQPDDYLAKVAKLIPAEIISAFVAIDAAVRSVGPQVLGPTAYWGVSLMLLIITPIYIWRVTSDPRLPTAWRQVVISTLSFAVWVFTLGGPFAYDERVDWYAPIWGTIILPIYTLLVPMFLEKKASSVAV